MNIDEKSINPNVVFEDSYRFRYQEIINKKLINPKCWPDPPKSGKMVTRPDPTCGSMIHPTHGQLCVDNRRATAVQPYRDLDTTATYICILSGINRRQWMRFRLTTEMLRIWNGYATDTLRKRHCCVTMVYLFSESRDQQRLYLWILDFCSVRSSFHAWTSAEQRLPDQEDPKGIGIWWSCKTVSRHRGSSHESLRLLQSGSHNVLPALIRGRENF